MKILIPEGPKREEDRIYRAEKPNWLDMKAIQSSDTFFFQVWSRCRFIKTNEIGAAAAIAIINNTPTILWNPEWMDQITDIEAQYLIFKHEALHLVLAELGFAQSNFYDGIFANFLKKELTDKWDFKDMQRQLVNIAMDLSVNSHLDLPDGVARSIRFTSIDKDGKEVESGLCIPGVGRFKDFPPFLSSADYLARLLTSDDYSWLSELKGLDDHEIPEELKGRIRRDTSPGERGPKIRRKVGENGEVTFEEVPEGESDGDNPSEEDDYITRHKMQNIIRQAYQHGNTSIRSELRDLIYDHLINPVNWEQELSNFVNARIRSDSFSTVHRINRKYPYQHAGRKFDKRPKLALSIDQSGSVDDDQLATFFAQIAKLAELVEFTVIPFDCNVAVDKIYVWKKSEKRNWERVLQGGTNFDAPTEYVNGHDFDGHIILTDTWAPFPNRSKCQRIWFAVKDINNPEFFNEAAAQGERIITCRRLGAAA
jgi:predicted metal-dependent peptidase